MPETPYVSESAAQLARDWERRFQQLPSQAGVVFVSIRPRPAPGGQVRSFDVRIGILPKLEEGLGAALIKNILEKEVASGFYEFFFEAWRGVPCAARHEGAVLDPV